MSGFFPSGKGRPVTELRLLVRLLYVQHTYRSSDEAVVARWGENLGNRHCTGEPFFQHRPPDDASSLTRMASVTYIVFGSLTVPTCFLLMDGRGLEAYLMTIIAGNMCGAWVLALIAARTIGRTLR